MQSIFQFIELEENAKNLAIENEVNHLLETDDYLAISFKEMGINLKDSIPIIYHTYKDTILEMLNKQKFNKFGTII